MPRKAADLEEALKKKGGLTLSQLANYDDVLTDALVDRIYFWSTIRKLKSTYHPSRGVQEEEVCKILQRDVIIDKDATAAHKNLLELSGIKKFLKALKTEDEKEHFERHLRKYVNIYLPDCPFEVGTTNRYTVMTAEAAIIARRPIRKGEPIKYLSGIQVEMTEQEEKELSSRTDFSIVLSSRRKRPSLFLGPARFANHDCDSNARLNTSGPHGIHIVACKDIAAGDEITVVYGEDYFGVDNCECLCGSCESLLRNGWDPRGPLLREDSSDEDDEDDGERESETRSTSNRGQHLHKRQALASAKNKRKRSSEDDDSTNEEQLRNERGSGLHKKRRLGNESAEESSDSGDQDTNESDMYIQRTPGGTRIKQEPTYSWASCSRDRTHEARTPNSMDHVLNLLYKVGDRIIGQKGEVEKSTPSRSSRGRTTSTEIPDERSMSRESSRRTRGGAVHSPGSNPEASPFTNELSLDSGVETMSSTERRESLPKGKLQSIKKSTRFSNLRNVTSADETSTNVFTVPSSPAPAAEPVQSRRGTRRQSQKQAKADENTDSSVESTSPSSHGTENSSVESFASSTTSVDVFAAGDSIAQSICDMLTSDIRPQGADDQISPHISDSSHAAEATETDDGSSGPRRGRRSLRAKASAISTAAIKSIETSQSKDSEDDDTGRKRGPARRQGDYILCKALLGTAYHRWVECRNCDEHFVQAEAFLTRIACPRCERHSKLYGYYWPKTDREGKWDKEERVLDHRTIHRFIEPDDERSERKGRKTLAAAVQQRELSRRESEESEVVIDRRLRVSPRRSESNRRRLRKTM